MMDLEDELTTTVVGSYPSQPKKKDLIRSYYDKSDPFKESLKRAVEDQVECSIELISDGQTRAGMVELFAGELSGYRIKEKVELVSKVRYDGAITVDDQKFVKKMISEDIGLKGIVTGPYTLVKSSNNEYYNGEKEPVMDTAEALHEEVVNLADICDVVQIDEPLFSIDYPDYGREAVEKVVDIDEVPIAMHVCGDISDIISELVEFNVEILDHEFTSNPILYEEFDDIDFPQRLAVGVVSTEPEVEKVSVIGERIERAYDLFGPETLVDPDCGLRNLDVRTAKMKLKNMVKAKEGFLDEREGS
ncbi:MAG: methionine synthase [Candidatus Thermoplasmatota archaeon]